MNHLAHLLLAGTGPDERIGALLGDHVKGTETLRRLPPNRARGVVLHRRIDRWSDTHPAVTGIIRQLEPPWRRYGGVLLDVLFDHMLDRHWSRFADQPLDRFADDVEALLARHRGEFPRRLGRFTLWAEQVDLWRRFGDRRLVEEIFRRLARRHGHPSPLGRGLELLDAREGEIERAFLVLFPDLQCRARAFLAEGRRDGAVTD